MKRINFKELNVEISIDSFENMDGRQEIGNTLHRASESVPMSDLAKKIYYSEGPIDITDKDYEEMMRLICRGLKKFVIDALLRSTLDVKEEEVK